MKREGRGGGRKEGEDKNYRTRERREAGGGRGVGSGRTQNVLLGTDTVICF